MYFIKRGKVVCHILEDTRDGKAPCGVEADRLDLISLWAGRATPQIMTERPSDIPLCKHCEQVTLAQAGSD
jgi:hypothetical protein